MAPKVKAVRSRAKPPARPSDPTVPPAPFKPAAAALAPFLAHLDPAHVYITHVDLKPTAFKRNIFLEAGVPVDVDVAARRQQVFAFRDALAAVGKEDLFFRWIEIVQYESTQPGGFGPERQVDAAKKIRDLFSNEGIDFDEFWKESVGEDAEASF
ncbi:hypothetical protein VdG1_05181 [Verticillium dahliae VDG1]|nr:hypothetical protein VdG1_05181 [Verticillium dahliae VDG1]